MNTYVVATWVKSDIDGGRHFLTLCSEDQLPAVLSIAANDTSTVVRNPDEDLINRADIDARGKSTQEIRSIKG